MLSSFHRIPECDGRTDGRTDGQTDRIAISVSSVSELTCDNNGVVTYCRNFQLVVKEK